MKLLLAFPILFRIGFALYALLVIWASLRTGGGPQPIEHFDKALHFTFYGVLMEILQSFVPSRFMSLADIIANTSGIIIVAVILFKLRLHR